MLGKKRRVVVVERNPMSVEQLMGCFRGGRNNPLWAGVNEILIAMEEAELLIGGQSGATVDQKAEALSRVDQLRQVRAQIEDKFDEATSYFREAK